jgi:hypothetical protein
MKNILICILFSLTLISCEKENIQSGIQTKVSGTLTNYLGAPIVNIKVKIGEFKNRFVSDGGSTDYFSKYIDSTYTNSLGEYEITFTSTGQGSSYRVIIENSPTDQSYYGLNDSVEIKNLGHAFVFNSIQFIKLYPCDVTINMNNITILPISIFHETTRQINNPEISSNTVFIKRIYITNNVMQKLTFQRIKPNGKYQKAVFTFPASNSELSTTQNITLNESDFIDL